MRRALLLLIAAALASAQPAPPQPASDEKAKKQATLQGQVLNLVTGEPVRKANVTLEPEGGGTNLKAATDNAGKFSIENIDPSRYTLAAERQGFVKQNYGARRPDGPGTAIELKTSEALKDLVIKLTPQGVIAGRVLDDEGEPVSGVSVQVQHYMYVGGKKRLMPAVFTPILTNDLGEFRAPSLSPGRYYVSSSPQKMADMLQPGKESPAKVPAEGFVPTYYPNAADPASASPVEVGPGAEVRGIDMRLRKTRVFRVSGKVMNAATGTALSPAVIMVFRREAGGISTAPSSMTMVQGDKGVFELRNVAAGGYNLLAMSANPVDMMMQMASLDVVDQDIEEIIISIGGGFEIPVTAKFEGEPPPSESKGDENSDPNSARKKNLDVELNSIHIGLDVDDNPMASLSNVQLGKDGKGLLKRVNPDKYKLMVTGLPTGAYLKSARFGDRDALEAGIDLRQGAAASLDLVIGAPAAELTGIVRNDKGDPIPGAIVTLVPKDPKARTDMSETGSTDQNGNIRMRGIVPGEYTVFAWEDIEEGAAEDDEFRKPFESKGTKLKLSEGSKESLQLTAITRAAIEEQKSKR